MPSHHTAAAWCRVSRPRLTVRLRLPVLLRRHLLLLRLLLLRLLVSWLAICVRWLVLRGLLLLWWGRGLGSLGLLHLLRLHVLVLWLWWGLALRCLLHWLLNAGLRIFT